MEAMKFKESNVVFAENQEEYKSLPALRSEDGVVVTCWKLSFREKVKLLINGKLWLMVMTFNGPIQPMYLSADKKEVIL